MLSLATRIDLLDRLGKYMLSDDEAWQEAKIRARVSNAWFNDESIETAVRNIAIQFLQKEKLEAWVQQYHLPENPKVVGIVMAGNIPLVGFHDFLCGFISGHKLMLKLSSKDEVLLKHLIAKLISYNDEVGDYVQVAEMLKGCDAYIATGSNNSARYFEQYFQKYHNIIRRNRTSVAVLDGTETEEELARLADDVFTYYGLGCRNVTQLIVPEGYDFEPLKKVFTKHEDLLLHHKYKNNYDYHLALFLLNKVPYFTNESLLFVENEIPFSAVAVLHYKYYNDLKALTTSLEQNTDIQCIVGHEFTPFGSAQTPSLNDYADGVDTMAFLCSL